MLKKKNISIEDVMKSVAKENGFTYVPPENRKPKEIIVETDKSGKSVVKIVNRTDKTSSNSTHTNNRVVVASNVKSNTKKVKAKFVRDAKKKYVEKKKLQRSLESNENCG